MENELLEQALSYHARGWSVIPVGKNKRPIIAWKKYQTERATEEEIREWFANPDTQIGIVTGAISNLTVIDVEQEGDTSMFKGIETYTVATGGKGYHFYFLNEPDMQNAVRTLPYMDVRSEGGYVVAGGSTSEKGPYSVVAEGEVVKMPDFIKRLMAPAPQTQHVVKEAYPIEHITDYPGYGEGQRNNEMTRYVGVILKRTHPSLWETVAWPMIVSANTRNHPPLTEHELTIIYNSISEREKTNGTGGYQMIGLHDGVVEEVPDIPEGEVDTGIGHVFDVADRQPVDTDVFYKTNIEQFDNALNGGLSPGDLVVFTGPTGNGKTSFAQDVTMSFAQKGFASLWFSYEVMPRPLAAKFRELGLTKEQPVYMPYSTEERTVEGIGRWARAAQKSKNIKLLVVDHLDFIYSERADKRLNNSDAIKAAVTELKSIATSLGLVVILMVHINKEFAGGTPDVRHITGSQAPGQLADSVFFLERMKNSKDQSMASYFADDTRIYMLKNRRTGQTPSLMVRFVEGRFVPNEAANEKYESYQKSKVDVDKQWEEMTGDKS